MYSLSPIQRYLCVFRERQQRILCFFILTWVLEACPKYVLWGPWLGVGHIDMMRPLLYRVGAPRPGQEQVEKGLQCCVGPTL